MDYLIKIDEFEGPMDLLLHLVKEDNIDIYDIDISKITSEYLEYLNKMEELNINVASSYIVMAAELMEIKSKSLLPVKDSDSSDTNNEEEILTKDDLINKLVEYKKYKDMTQKFKEMELSRQEIYVKSPEKISNYVDEVIVNNTDTTVDDLVLAFKKFLERKEKEKPITTKITNKEYNVKDRRRDIKNVLLEKKKVKFTELFDQDNISYIIVTFLSILEMTKEKEITILQDKNFSDINILLGGIEWKE